MNRAFYIPEINERIPVSNPNKQSYNEECRRFNNFTDTFIAQHIDCLNDTGVSLVAHVALSDDGEFVEPKNVSAKSNDAAPNFVGLELDTGDNGVSWRIVGVTDDHYEVIFYEDGTITVVANQMSPQNSLLSSRECPDEEAKMIFAVIKDILTSDAVKDDLKRFDPKLQDIHRKRIEELAGSHKHIKEAKKALLAQMHFKAGSSRSRVHEMGQVSGTPLYS